MGGQHWAQAGFNDLIGRHQAAQFVADGHCSVTTRCIAEMERSNWGQFTNDYREPCDCAAARTATLVDVEFIPIQVAKGHHTQRRLQREAAPRHAP